jgi:hypothetical protein
MAHRVYLGIATRRSAADVGSFHPEKLGVAIAVTLSEAGWRIFTEDTLSELALQLGAVEAVIGYNARKFDLEVLRAYPGFAGLMRRTMDLLPLLTAVGGARKSLQEWAATELGMAAWTDSLDRVVLWKAGNIPAVIEGCCNDVIAIKRLYERMNLPPNGDYSNQA